MMSYHVACPPTGKWEACKNYRAVELSGNYGPPLCTFLMSNFAAGEASVVFNLHFLRAHTHTLFPFSPLAHGYLVSPGFDWSMETQKEETAFKSLAGILPPLEAIGVDECLSEAGTGPPAPGLITQVSLSADVG